MEAMNLISLPNFTEYSSFPPVHCSQIINHSRGWFSFTANHHQCDDISIRRNSPRSCAKSSLGGNLEAVGARTSVPVRVAHELLQAGHRYLDVRTPEEFGGGHASGAINVPYMYRVESGMTKNPKFLEEVSSCFGKYDEIIVGCQSGKRSMMAATDLLVAGFTSVTGIAGGFAAWRQNELPTEP